MGMGIGRNAFMATTAIVCVATATPAFAQAKSFDVPAQSATTGIAALGRQADIQIVAARRDTEGKQVNAVRGDMTVEQAIAVLLKDTGLTARRTGSQTWSVVPAAAPQTSSAPATTDTYAATEIIVTAQKRAESVQNVPIAVSVLSQEDLSAQKIEGGPDIMRAVPNLTFSKSNFTSYNLSIRGVGTKAISATSDPGVAVSFNNTGLIHNRFFEQEFFDVERVEILRGPQGTLYGRNATGGVVNLISAKPDLRDFEGSIKGEVGNYNSRRMVGMLNVPIAKDVLGVRVAGSMTQRSGYDFNTTTGNDINGRDLWSLRTTVAFEPAPWFRASLVWERFREDDNRSRTGKQLCHRDDGPTHIGNTPVDIGAPTGNLTRVGFTELRRGAFSQSCLPGSLYDANAFGTPNGYSLPYILAFSYSGEGVNVGTLRPEDAPGGFNNLPNRLRHIVNPTADPYGGLMQSPNLREIASIRDPIYRASADLLQFNLELDITPALTFVSQTAYNEDKVYSFQDFNRFNSLPVFFDTSRMTRQTVSTSNPTGGGPTPFANLAPGGVFCDPQIGCSDTIAGFDISKAVSDQFSQEFRLQSSFDGPVNFSVGANYTRFKTLNDYYVMINALTALAYGGPFNGAPEVFANFPGGQFVPGYCTQTAFGVSSGFIPAAEGACPYVDPNPVESIDGEGHNYFRSKNPYSLKSYAAFGEMYWNIADDLKFTVGARYTDDRKSFIPVPSQLLLSPSLFGGGLVSKGYPEKPAIKRSWREFTGRIGLDWKPELGFTDDTLLYAFYSRGYKGGGVNPPSPGFATKEEYVEAALAAGINPIVPGIWEILNQLPVLELTGVEYGETFEPEFVNAIEIGMKNRMMGGRLTLNATAFYYDYKDYQVSQIRDRTAVNENFDATVWGAELEALFVPTPNLRINANVGYLRTKIGKGETSIDIMNRTQGDPNYVLVKPWIQLPSNCVVPLHVAEYRIATQGTGPVSLVCGGFRGALSGLFPFDPALNKPYSPFDYPELNGGAGLRADLSGNELPNSPRWTVNVGAEYTVNFDPDWSATIRGDGYWQAKSWHRVYNLAPYDRLRDWTNFNISLRVDGPENLSIEAYVKNVFNSTPITDAFLNSDDSGLTTNVFTLDPRIIGFSIAKKF